MNSDLGIPVVPIAVNTAAPPLPTMDRCFQLGEMLRQSIESWESDKKVAIVASGGLSHWVPIPKIDSEKQEDQGLIHILKNGRQEIEQLEEYLDSRKTRVTSLQTGPVNEEWDRLLLQLIKDKDFDSLGNGLQNLLKKRVAMAVRKFEIGLSYWVLFKVLNQM